MNLLTFWYRPIEGLSKKQNLTDTLAQIPDLRLIRKPFKLLQKGVTNTPEPIIPPEYSLLDPDFDDLKPAISVKPLNLDYDFDNDSSEENVIDYIPFDIDKDYEPQLVSSGRQESAKGRFPSFQGFPMEDSDLEDKLFSPNDSFHF